MDREERNRLRQAVEGARALLEREIGDQLEGIYNILADGTVLDDAPGDPIVRDRLIQMVAHHQARGAGKQSAVERVIRECAFTVLNRFAALKMAERRGLVRECVSNGIESTGIQELASLVPNLQFALEDGGYRLLLETLMDELSLGLESLFDRRSPTSLIWPRSVALGELLEIINAEDLAALWEQDETIGWIYQYFNSQDERQEMRKAGAPRNSRELAVRNQFFTPRYVVSFLSENTLGRLWYEMRKGRTRLAEHCDYLVYCPREVFLVEGQQAPQESSGETEYVRHRPQKDPRDLKILDPACGSGHFLLYCFDLLAQIYQEAWEDHEGPKSERTGRTLRQDYANHDALSGAIPGLILEHNLYGIDIDPRAVQIAVLALWMRAQRAYHQLGLAPASRPVIGKTNLVTAEPMPGERALLDELIGSLRPPLLGQVAQKVFEAMRLAGEAGSLLRIEREIASTLEQARREWEASPRQSQLALFGREQSRSGGDLDLSGITDERFWHEAEGQIYETLDRYARTANNGQSFRRQLFAHDAADGFAFIDVSRQRYDVVLMNPPFGAPSERSKSYITKSYPRTKNDLYAAFVERGIQWLQPRGLLGAITSRTGFFLKSFQRWREDILLKEAEPTVVADLGYGVLDTAMVEVAAYCLAKQSNE